MKKLYGLLLVAVILVSMAFGAVAENDRIVLQDHNTVEAVVRGGVLTVAKSKAMDEGLNITKISDASSHFTVMAQIYEGLLTIDENGKAAPGLATEWTFAEDGLSMTMKLREDVSFSDGTKFDAAAVAKCLNYYISEACGHIFKSSDLSLISGVDVVDEFRLFFFPLFSPCLVLLPVWNP